MRWAGPYRIAAVSAEDPVHATHGLACLEVLTVMSSKWLWDSFHYVYDIFGRRLSLERASRVFQVKGQVEFHFEVSLWNSLELFEGDATSTLRSQQSWLKRAEAQPIKKLSFSSEPGNSWWPQSRSGKGSET